MYFIIKALQICCEYCQTSVENNQFLHRFLFVFKIETSKSVKVFLKYMTMIITEFV